MDMYSPIIPSYQLYTTLADTHIGMTPAHLWLCRPGKAIVKLQWSTYNHNAVTTFKSLQQLLPNYNSVSQIS